MAVAFPPSLQQLVNQQGFSLKTGETVIRSETDTGPVKLRRRSTRPIDSVSVSINLTTAQYSTLDYFYKTTTNAGVTRFELNHPITGVLTEYRFKSPPSYSPLGGGNFIASMEWEIMIV